jgi:hypothetical protein
MEDRLVAAIQDRDGYRLLAYEAINQLAIVTKQLKQADNTITRMRKSRQQLRANPPRLRAQARQEPVA